MNHAARSPGESPLSRRRARPVAARVHESGREPATELRYEGLVTRAIAFALDAAVINLVAIVVAGGVALALSVLSVPKDSLDTVLIAAGGALFLAWSVGYFVTFWSTTGQTPGSRLMRIAVRSADDGSVLRPRQAALRFAFLVLAAIPFLAGFLPILFDSRRRGMHDMLAGTVVVEAQVAASRESAPSRPRTPRR
jgi:uncharacterized RDD family membrane protein YckC